MKKIIFVSLLAAMFVFNYSYSNAGWKTRMGVGGAAYETYKAAKKFKQMKKAAENVGYHADPQKNKQHYEEMMDRMDKMSTTQQSQKPKPEKTKMEKVKGFIKEQLLID